MKTAVPVQEDLEGLYLAFDDFVTNLRSFLGQLNEKDMGKIFGTISNIMNLVCAGDMDNDAVKSSSSDLEQFKLFSAALPTSAPMRESTLQACDFMCALVDSAKAMHLWHNTFDFKDQCSQIRGMVASFKTLSSFSDLSQSAEVVVKVISSTGLPSEACLQKDTLSSKASSLLEEFAKEESQWITNIVPWQENVTNFLYQT